MLNHRLEEPDMAWKEFTDRVLAQDHVIAEAQRPEEIQTDFREELHLNVPDGPVITYRRLLGQIEQVAAFLP